MFILIAQTIAQNMVIAVWLNNFEPGGLIQREPDLKTRIQERIETLTESVGKASEFLKDKADEASARPELQKNPALGR